MNRQRSNLSNNVITYYLLTYVFMLSLKSPMTLDISEIMWDSARFDDILEWAHQYLIRCKMSGKWRLSSYHAVNAVVLLRWKFLNIWHPCSEIIHICFLNLVCLLETACFTSKCTRESIMCVFRYVHNILNVCIHVCIVFGEVVEEEVQEQDVDEEVG